MARPTPTVIRAVAEDSTNIQYDLYPGDPKDIEIILASAIPTTTTTPHHQKDITKMSAPNMTGFDPRHVTAGAAAKRYVPGINGGGGNGAANIPRLLDALSALGLCREDLATPLKQLVAAGQPVGQFLKVDVYRLDDALAGCDATLSNRMAFKAALGHAGLLATR